MKVVNKDFFSQWLWIVRVRLFIEKLFLFEKFVKLTFLLLCKLDKIMSTLAYGLILSDSKN